MGEVYREESGEGEVMSSEKSKLNTRQRKFIDNLFEGMSQKRAYEEAGYKSKFPYQNASKLARKDYIIVEIEERKKEINIRNNIRLSRISETALAGLLVIVKSGSDEDKVKLDAIKDVLDRVGLKPVERFAIGGDKKLEPLRIIVSKEDYEFAEGKKEKK